MTTDEKLDRIIALLEGMQRTRAGNVSAADMAAQAAIERALTRLLPGRYTAGQIACAAGLPDDRVTAHTVGRVMERLGFQRFRTGSQRGFVVPVTGH